MTDATLKKHLGQCLTHSKLAVNVTPFPRWRFDKLTPFHIWDSIFVSHPKLSPLDAKTGEDPVTRTQHGSLHKQTFDPNESDLHFPNDKSATAGLMRRMLSMSGDF